MSKKWLLSTVFLFSLSSPGQAAEFDFRQAGGDAEVRQLFASFMTFSGDRKDDLEHAAFMVRDGDGQLSCVQFPFANWERSRTYRGVIPAGTVAIVRIHPWGLEKPSAEDITQAARSGLPVYILTRWNIYAVDPASGEKVPLISRQDWSSGLTGSDVRCSTMKNWRTVRQLKTAAK